MAAGSRRIGSRRTDSAATGPGRGTGRGTAPGKGSARGATKTAAGSRGGRGGDKAAKAAARATKKAARKQRFSQLKQAFAMTRKADPKMLPLVLAALLGPFVLLLVIGFVVGHPFLLGLVGLLIGLIAATAVFGRRVQGNAYSQVEGELGAAAAVLNGMRGDWRVTPMVGFTREQDMVHRVVGRPGVVLVAEGAGGRTRTLLVNEKKKLARFVGDVPVYDVTVGDGEGQVPLRGLEKHFAKLPRNVAPKDVNVLDRKLKAMAPALPIPKGPVPRGGRMPRQR